MKRILIVATLIALAGCTRFKTTDARLDAGIVTPYAPAAVELTPSVAAIVNYEFGQSRKPLIAVENEIRAAMASPSAARAMAAQMGAVLQHGNSTREAKDFACRQLWLIGGEENVGSIAPLLQSPDTADMARYALEKIPGKQSDLALIAALETAPDSVKPGIINSLANRGSAEGKQAVRKQAKSSTPEVAMAVKAALGD